MDNNDGTYTYTKEELLEGEEALTVLAERMLEPMFVSKRDAIIIFSDFHTAFRKLVPNSLWKG